MLHGQFESCLQLEIYSIFFQALVELKFRVVLKCIWLIFKSQDSAVIFEHLKLAILLTETVQFIQQN